MFLSVIVLFKPFGVVVCRYARLHFGSEHFVVTGWPSSEAPCKYPLICYNLADITPPTVDYKNIILYVVHVNMNEAGELLQQLWLYQQHPFIGLLIQIFYSFTFLEMAVENNNLLKH